MTTRNVRIGGLTVVEVLVIAGLAGLLIGSLGRGRGGDPKERTCLGNLKQICTAMQMYLDDYDGLFPPVESRRDVIEYFDGSPGGGQGSLKGRAHLVSGCPLPQSANPYLRWPVILDPYLPSNGTWRCPSARLEQPALFINAGPDWLAYLRDHEGQWGMKALLCPRIASYPRGWGGEVTDSVAQGRLAVPRGQSSAAAPPGVFVQSVAANCSLAGRNAREVSDPAWLVVFADGGAQVESIGTGTLAYPDICALECANEACGWVDWEECTWAADCGLYHHAPNDGSFLRDPALRAPYSRHRGGVNIGFLDGHASWFASEEVIRQSPSKRDPERGRLRGFEPPGPTSDCGFAEDNPGVPTLY